MRLIRYLTFLLTIWFSLLSETSTKTPNPYKILGVPRDATKDQIKQGFKKRSRKYHPDKNIDDPRASDKYAKVTNAYELLKDPERRRMYDMTGDDNPQQHGMGGGFGMGDIMGGFGFGGGGQQRGQRRGSRTTYTFTMGGGQGMRYQF